MDLKPGWHRIEIGFQGPVIEGNVDGKRVTSIHDTAHAAGMFALGSDWTKAQFDNLNVSK